MSLARCALGGAAIAATLLPPLLHPAREGEVHRLGHPSMGTVLHCEWRAADHGEDAALRAVGEALARVDEVEEALSHYRPGSELSRFNGSPPAHTHRPSPILRGIFARAESWRATTGGAFSCRLQPLLALRGFIPSPPGVEPTGADLWERICPEAIVLGPEGLTKRIGGAGLDFDGIAKGYALDLAAERLRGRTTELFLSYGSTGLLAGEGAGRVLAVPDPRRSGPGAPAALALWLGEGAFSTSSCAENRRAGLCHIIDPRTLQPAEGGGLSATVLAPSAADADALSTAFLVLGPDESMALARRLGVEVALLAELPFRGSRPWKGIHLGLTEGLEARAEVAP